MVSFQTFTNAEIAIRYALHREFRVFLRSMMDWVGASVIAPPPHVPIEFEIAAETGVHRGFFRDSRFYSTGDPAGYPRKMVRRWRYLAEDPAHGELSFAAGH